jgi:hypothetical protein
MSLEVVIFADILSALRQNVKTPNVTKSPQSPHKNSTPEHKYPQGLDINPQTSYSSSITPRRTLMSVAYQQAQKQRYRVTLDLSVFGDFDPHQIDWEKLFKLEPAEKCDAYVEDLSTPDRW